MNQKIRLFLTVVLVLLSACSPIQEAGLTSTPSLTAEPSLVPTATPIPVPSPTPIPGIWLDVNLPPAFLSQVQIPGGWQKVEKAEEAQVQVFAGKEFPGSEWIYALAAAFPTITDNVTSLDLKSLWTDGTPIPQANISHLVMEESTRNMFAALWGEPGSAVQVQEADTLLKTAWEDPTIWAIIPFELIEPQWKIVAVDGISPINKEFDPADYPLSGNISVQGPLVESMSPGWFPQTNRDPGKLTTVMMTGVTAMVRGTASTMAIMGMTYPAQNIAGLLQSADITHISNEIPFAENCPKPGMSEQDGLVFCSRPETIELLEHVGTDVVELTGDHFSDWGPEAMLYTIQLYNEHNWPYYGGGANLDDARKAVLFEHNGNKIAFLGCNGKAPGYAKASPNNPGAYHCNMDYMIQEIQSLKSQGYLPIVTFQHEEVYVYGAHPALQPDFQKVADAGAVVVSGSQAHMPHAMEFRNGAFIHYGLGNLFFDQYNWDETTDDAFLDQHVFYNGRYINTQLFTIKFVDYALSRLMTSEERTELLSVIFKASWGPKPPTP